MEAKKVMAHLFKGKDKDGNWHEGFYFETIPETTVCYIISNNSPYNSEVRCDGTKILAMYDYWEVLPETIKLLK